MPCTLASGMWHPRGDDVWPAVASLVLIFATGGAAQSQPAALEDAVARVLSDDRAPFDARAALVGRVKTALDAELDAETRGRLALLWMRAIRRTLAAVPFDADGTRDEPYRTWLAAHETEVVYSEPAGQWLVSPERAWQLHDANRRTASAEPLAWEIVENGVPGECEGYPPCYLAGFELLHTRYLREYPAGEHVEQAVMEISESLDQIRRLITGPDAGEFFDPKTDCKDLVTGAESLNMALAKARVETTATRRVLREIKGKC